MTSFGPNGASDMERADTPAGAVCEYCKEQILEGESGYLMNVLGLAGPGIVPCHVECFLRQIVGSVSHQLHTCSCYGGHRGRHDPEGMTKRQAALAAVKVWNQLNGPGPKSERVQ